MKMSSCVRGALIVGAVSCLFLGAGCSKTPQEQSADVQQRLREPESAKAPTQEPVIPPEAAKIPKPY